MAEAENPFPVVGIGASAGGLSALTGLLSALPPRPGLALVVIQHLGPKHESRLSELLQPHTSMSVVEARHGVKVAPDHVYVIQPNTSVAIATGCSPSHRVPMIGGPTIPWTISCGHWQPCRVSTRLG